MRLLTNALLISLFTCLCVADSDAQELFAPTKKQGSLKLRDAGMVVREQRVTVNTALIRGVDNARFTLTMPDGVRMNVVKERERKYLENGYVWVGGIEGQPESTVIFALAGETVAGDIWTGKLKNYQLRFIGEGVYSLAATNVSKLIAESKSKPQLPSERRAPKGSPGKNNLLSVCSDSPYQVDVMVLYDAATLNAMGTKAAVEANIYLGLEWTNQIFINSGLNTRAYSVHIVQANNPTSTNPTQILSDLRTGNDVFSSINDTVGGTHTVQQLRDMYGADVVAMSVGTMFQSSMPSYPSVYYSQPDDYAFSLFNLQFVGVGAYYLSQAIGLNLGADHECGQDSGLSPPEARAMANTFNCSGGGCWKSVMSTDLFRIPYFTRPGYFNPGDGWYLWTICNGYQTDNTTVVNMNSHIVSNYRCTSPNVPDVWMKDQWSDTGQEPDPNTDAVMWASPYIWNRRQPDPSRIHQHEHEEPKAGYTNYLYVKLHNGASSAPISGKVLVYQRSALTNADWDGGTQTNWVSINPASTTLVTTMQPNSTQIVEIPWSIPATASGHECLLVRWVSAQDPMHAENLVDIWFNVKDNNNIISRNMNYVDFQKPGPSVEFETGSSANRSGDIALTIGAPEDMTQPNFLRYGQLLVKFDARLIEAWSRGGRKGKGFRVDGSAFLVTDPKGATFEGIKAEKKVSYKVSLTFRKLPQTIPRRFVIDAIQFQSSKGITDTRALRTDIMGGMRYVIDTYPTRKSSERQ